MFRIIGAFALVYLSCVDGRMSGKWDYTIISSFANSTNVALLNPVMNVVRAGRGVYAFSGNLDINFQGPGDTIVSMDVLRSSSGVGEYTKLAMGFPKQTFDETLNTHYKDYIMTSIKDCSNMPQFEGNWTGQLGDEHWVFDRCILDQKNIKIYLQDGYYKLHIIMESSEKVFIEFLARVVTRIY